MPSSSSASRGQIHARSTSFGRARIRRSLLPLCLAAASLALAAAPADAQYTRVSIGHDGAPADGASSNAIISGNGRFVAFTSAATNLVPGDTNGVADVFVRDLQTNITTRVSVATGGAQATAASELGGISDDGSIIVFETRAALAAADTAECPNGGDPPSACSDVYVHNRGSGETTPISVSTDGGFGNGHSITPRLSGDGRYVVFASLATNFGADTNGVQDIFLRDRQTSLTTRVSIGPEGETAKEASRDPAISRNGKVVAFLTRPTAFNTDPGGYCGALGGCEPTYVRNLETGSTQAVPWQMVSAVGRAAFRMRQLSLSANGRMLSVYSFNIWHTIPTPFTFSQTEIYDLETGTAFYGGVGGRSTLSDDGRYLASGGDTSTYSGSPGFMIADRHTGIDSKIATEAESTPPSWTASGRHVTFLSRDATLVAGDTNGVADVFVYDRDQDGDGIPTAWEQQWGLNPDSPADATADADGDGLTNAEEFAANAHPRATHTRYFAEGAANDFFATQLSVLNPSAAEATVLLRLLGQGGAVTTKRLVLPANSRSAWIFRRGVDVPAPTFAIIVESDQLVVADRVMRWQTGLFSTGASGAYGSTVESATEAPRQAWHFAEGATGPFSMYYLLQNPGDQPASVTIDYLRPAGHPVISKTTRSRRTAATRSTSRVNMPTSRMRRSRRRSDRRSRSSPSERCIAARRNSSTPPVMRAPRLPSRRRAGSSRKGRPGSSTSTC